MRNQNTHKQMKFTINKVVAKVIYLFAVFNIVCIPNWIRAASISQPLDNKPAL